jgi:hypothetical protein
MTHSWRTYLWRSLIEIVDVLFPEWDSHGWCFLLILKPHLSLSRWNEGPIGFFRIQISAQCATFKTALTPFLNFFFNWMFWRLVSCIKKWSSRSSGPYIWSSFLQAYLVFWCDEIWRFLQLVGRDFLINDFEQFQ